jgi:16S rRNA (cytosine(967)-C(5))-methyltransferase
LNSKKLFDNSNSGKTICKHAKKNNDASTKKESKSVEKIGSNFNQKKSKDANQAVGKPIKPVNPRQLSFFILNRYFSEKSNLKFLLNDFLIKYPLSELDKRFVYEVVKGTVRYVIRIDFLISLFSNKNIKSLDKDVLNIIRQAVYQMIYMDKTPGYAAVYENVEIAKKHIGTYSSRFVNAVLRKINALQRIQEFLDDSIKNACGKPAERLSLMYSYPEWLADYWIKSYGVDRAELLFGLLNREPAVFIRVNRLKTDKIKLINTFKENGMLQGRDYFSEPFDNVENADSPNTEPVAEISSLTNSPKITAGAAEYITSCGSAEITANNTKIIGTAESHKINAATEGNITSDDTTGISSEKTGCIGNYKKTGLFDDCIILKSVQNIEKIPGYLQGHFSVQDFSSQFAIKYFLDPTRDDRILDICSAPGGKATYIAEITGDKAEILSVDISKNKMDLMQDNIARLGIKNISFVNADATETDFLRHSRFENYFDKIFIDAPCSALGTISKNPDAKYANTLPDMERLGKITGKILCAADKYLKPGGIIILYKCTLSEIENQGTVKRFVDQDPSKYRIYDPFFEIMPDRFSSEAGFICMLKKSV